MVSIPKGPSFSFIEIVLGVIAGSITEHFIYWLYRDAMGSDEPFFAYPEPATGIFSAQNGITMGVGLLLVFFGGKLPGKSKFWQAFGAGMFLATLAGEIRQLHPLIKQLWRPEE